MDVVLLWKHFAGSDKLRKVLLLADGAELASAQAP